MRRYLATLIAFSSLALLGELVRAADPPRRPDLERGRALFVERCVLCHGKEGKGWDLTVKVPRPPVPIPDLSDPAFMREFTEAELFEVIKEGGTRAGKSRFMPPAGPWLSDEEIWDLVGYVRALVKRSPGAGEGVKR